MTARKLRGVFFGELGSTFSRLHYAALKRSADVALWVATRRKESSMAARQPFLSRADWWERLMMRAQFEWQTLYTMRAPLARLTRIACDVHETFRGDRELSARLHALQPDLIISAGFSRILPESILEIPDLGAFNCHPSPLPRYAGSNPWFWILRHGETRSAVTVHRMTARVDAGAIVRQQWFAVRPNDNHQSLYNRSSLFSAMLLRSCLADWAHGIFPAVAQDLSQQTYFRAPREEDYRIDWSWSREAIVNLVRAAYPSARAWAEVGGRRVSLRRVTALNTCQTNVGTAYRNVHQKVCVSCSDGAIQLDAVAYEGRELRGSQLHGVLNIASGPYLT